MPTAQKAKKIQSAGFDILLQALAAFDTEHRVDPARSPGYKCHSGHVCFLCLSIFSNVKSAEWQPKEKHIQPIRPVGSARHQSVEKTYDNP